MRDFRFNSQVILQHPREQVFEFFSQAENLNFLTPPWVRFSILTPPPIEMKTGTLIQYRIRVHGIPIRWDSEITQWDPPFRFQDTQRRGPYSQWVHSHIFEEVPEGTLVIDEVEYRVPGGRLVNWLYVAAELRRIFNHRLVNPPKLPG
ncbi:hypothetical protein GBAR_LOCUS30816 [Geodia barretti]|uniref:Coenzyme Q-binding protein COQ10 START domain-containing protein n=1 Tax=Geodia barretti TaxID=519541 RepID=A0AA35XF70_GEOBA|nr:hypothetical protein GBAR_LOCUS30816 [Geodia barretti]